jgi:hypothetical protein
MRKEFPRIAFPTLAAAICALGLVLALRAGGTASTPASGPDPRPAPDLAPDPAPDPAGLGFPPVLAESPVLGSDPGRYRIAVVGSRGPQRFGTAFRIDTATGRAWRAIVRQDLNEGWAEILETEGKGPAAGESPGRYDLSADLISDKLGQEAGIAGRIDTRTGRSWFLQPLPDAPRWIPIEDAPKGPGAER